MSGRRESGRAGRNGRARRDSEHMNRDAADDAPTVRSCCKRTAVAFAPAALRAASSNASRAPAAAFAPAPRHADAELCRSQRSITQASYKENKRRRDGVRAAKQPPSRNTATGTRWNRAVVCRSVQAGPAVPCSVSNAGRPWPTGCLVRVQAEVERSRRSAPGFEAGAGGRGPAPSTEVQQPRRKAPRRATRNVHDPVRSENDDDDR